MTNTRKLNINPSVKFKKQKSIIQGDHTGRKKKLTYMLKLINIPVLGEKARSRKRA